MSDIARLLLEQGRIGAEARRASGDIWGRTIANVSQIPGQALEAQQQRDYRAQQMALQQAREGREAQSAGEEHQMRVAQLESMRQKQAGDWAEKLRIANANVPTVTAEIDAQIGKLWTPEEGAALKQTVAQPGGLERVITRLAPVQEPMIGEADPTKDLINKRTGVVVRPATAKAPKTKAELAADAANPTSPTQAQSKTALGLITAEPVPRPLDQQLLEAVAAGDTNKVGQIKQTLLTAAQARRDPDAAATARQLAGLRADEARARLDALQEKAKPLDIAPDVQTTRSGKSYVDLSQYSVSERDKARKAASDAGAVPVSKEQASALQEIDNARANQQSIQDQIRDLLPKSTGGRAGAAVMVPLSKLFQTNDQIAAYNSWRTAAIQTLRATAGSKGLRINRSEIDLAIENDIPKLTDTLSVAQQKLKNINTMLDNAETSIAVRDRSVSPSTPQTAAPTLTPGLAALAGRK